MESICLGLGPYKSCAISFITSKFDGGGGCIKGWGICCPLLALTVKGGCVVPIGPSVEGSGSS